MAWDFFNMVANSGIVKYLLSLSVDMTFLSKLFVLSFILSLILPFKKLTFLSKMKVKPNSSFTYLYSVPFWAHKVNVLSNPVPKESISPYLNRTDAIKIFLILLPTLPDANRVGFEGLDLDYIFLLMI